MDEQKQPGNMNKNYLYAVIAVIVIAIIAWAIYANTHKDSDDNQSKTPQQTTISNTPTDTMASTTPTTTPTTTTGGGTKKLSHADAVAKYPYRIQFTLQCQGIPGSLVVKKGDTIMLDNRDQFVHTIVADGQTFKIAAQDYALLHTTTISNQNVTCDGKGAMLLNVAK
jgi:hypothetical protein